MLNVNLDRPAERPLRLLCIGAHCDDIEIGSGGTILQLLAGRRKTEVEWVVFSSDDNRKEEALQSARAFLKNAADAKIIVQKFRDGFLPYYGAEIKEEFEKIKGEFSPDVILTHHRNDLHQDHRFISEMTWNTFRDHFILEYEIPKYDGDLGSPNFFIHLDEGICRTKIEFILQNFRSQAQRRWFDDETFKAIMRLRGVESNATEKYAEAFYCRKIVLASSRIGH
jgi:LmbE family N-acetylglucosaminyl deacetylase